MKNGGTMDYNDYYDWAQEYRQQELVLEKKLKNRRGKNSNLTLDQQIIFDNTTKQLYAMKLECRNTALILENKAQRIKERAYNA